MRKESGFTLIELMIVVAIVGILMAIAVPAYQDYTVRSKLTEAVAALGPAKLSVAEYRLSDGRWPTQSEAGYELNIGTKYVQSVLWDETSLSLVVKIEDLGGATAAGQQFLMEATLTTSQAAVDWDCQPGTVKTAYLPATCRDTGFP